ncbi:MAG: DNA recombination protein RmuC [Dongiaceae bacterium]
MPSSVLIIIGVVAAGVGILAWLIVKARPNSSPLNEIAGKISLLAEAQTRLQTALTEKLHTQENAITKHLFTHLEDMKQRLKILDLAQKNINDLSGQVVNLQALFSNKQARGNFGEVRLNDLMIDALPQSAYEFQAPLNGNRVDCLLRLPGPPGAIAIDSKFPLEGWQALYAEEGDTDAARKTFIRDIKKHIDAISEKYIVPGLTADSAIMFLPSEAVFATIHSEFEDILRYAQKNRVWITSPNTLMALLNTVRAVLRDAHIREEAGRIQAQVGELTKEMEKFVERLQKLGNTLGAAQRAYDEAMVTAGKIEKLGGKITAIEEVTAESRPVLTVVENAAIEKIKRPV